MRKLLTAAVAAATIAAGTITPASAQTVSPEVAQKMFGNFLVELTTAETTPACSLRPPMTPEKEAIAEKAEKISQDLENMGALADQGENQWTPTNYRLMMLFFDKVEKIGRLVEPYTTPECPKTVLQVAQDGRKNFQKYSYLFGVKDTSVVESHHDHHAEDSGSSSGMILPLVIVGAVIAAIVAVATNPALLPRP